MTLRGFVERNMAYSQQRPIDVALLPRGCTYATMMRAIYKTEAPSNQRVQQSREEIVGQKLAS
jgi:hypothetical protein